MKSDVITVQSSDKEHSFLSKRPKAQPLTSCPSAGGVFISPITMSLIMFSISGYSQTWQVQLHHPTGTHLPLNA